MLKFSDIVKYVTDTNKIIITILTTLIIKYTINLINSFFLSRTRLRTRTRSSSRFCEKHVGVAEETRTVQIACEIGDE
jgi:hypothetical protein